MTKEEFINRINEKWKQKVFENCKSYLLLKKNNGLYWAEKDEDNNKVYYCHGKVDKHGRPIVHVYETEEEWWNDDVSVLSEVSIFFSIIKDKVRSKIFDIRCYFQRARKGYCDKDLYSIGTWFLRIVPKMIRELKDKPAYIPTDENGEVISTFNGKMNNDYKFGEVQNWYKLLENISMNFDMASYENDDNNPYDVVNENKQYNNWNINKDKFKEEKLKAGFELFIKHFWRIGW